MQSVNVKNEFKQLAFLSVPLIISGLIEFSSGFFGTYFLGHVSTQALAAGSLMSNVFIALMVFPWGLLNAISVIVSQHHGAKQDEAIVQTVKSALLLALALSPLAILILLTAPLLLQLLHQDPNIIAMMIPGLHAYAWGMLPDLIILTLLQYVMGLGHARLNMLFSLFWAPCNMLFVAAFIFGLWHFPKLGVAGIGWGFSVSSWLAMLVIVSYLGFSARYRKHRDYFKTIIFHSSDETDSDRKERNLKSMKHILTIGVPIGGTYLVDLVYFLIYSLMMGALGVTLLAAHQIVMQYFWMASVGCFAIGQAISVRVGHSIGANAHERIAPITSLGIVFMLFIMLGIACTYWFLPEQLVAFDLSAQPSSELLQFARTFFLIAGFSLLLQAGWISLLSTLRGMGDTHALLILSIIAEFLVGLPLAYLLAFHTPLYAKGIWLATLLDSIVFIGLATWRIRYKLATWNPAT